VALPPELENAPNASHYVMPGESPVDGPVRVILGSPGKMTSPIDAPPMNYLVVSLKAGERWSYEPPKGHEVAWVAVHEGMLRTPSPVPRGEIAIFEPSEAAIDFLAEGDTVFVLGSAPPHRHSSHSAATPFTRAQRPCAKEKRRFAASARASSPKARRATRSGNTERPVRTAPSFPPSGEICLASHGARTMARYARLIRGCTRLARSN
jgi:hypothetical protein